MRQKQLLKKENSKKEQESLIEIEVVCLLPKTVPSMPPTIKKVRISAKHVESSIIDSKNAILYKKKRMRNFKSPKKLAKHSKIT